MRNGLLLRADLHRLFEQGYLTVTPDYVLNVSDRLRDDYQKAKVIILFEAHESQCQLERPNNQRAIFSSGKSKRVLAIISLWS